MVCFFAAGRVCRIALGRHRARVIHNPVDAAVLAVCRDKHEAELFAHDPGEEAADRMRLPLRCTGHCLDGCATWRSQHCDEVSLFAFTACRRWRHGPRLLMRRGRNGLEGCRVACARSPYAVTALGLAVASA